MSAARAKYPPDWTAYRSSYGTSHNRRVHIRAPGDARPRSSVRDSIAFCGVLVTPVWDVVDPGRLPARWSWCSGCLGKAAEYLCQSDRVATLVWEALKSGAANSMPTAEELLTAAGKDRS